MTKVLTLACVVLAAGSVWAQGLSGSVSPNPAPPGAPVTLTVAAAGQMAVFPDGCLIHRVTRVGDDTIVWSPGACTDQLVELPLGSLLSETWNGLDYDGARLPAGDYWLHVDYFAGGLPPLVQARFPFRITSSALEPALIPMTAAAAGRMMSLGVQAPAHAGGIYAIAASLTSAATLEVLPGKFAALELDPLFWASFPNPDPFFFENFQGSLDASGSATNIRVRIPNEPALSGHGFVLQGVVIVSQAQGGLALTNPLSMIIQ